MNKFLHGVVRAVAETFSLPGPVLEVGSYQVEGQEAHNLRPLFPGREYIGVDIRPGPGVDCVGSVEALPYPDGSIGTVLAMNTFEHVPRFWRGFEEVRRVLRPDGALLVSCPFHLKMHNYPSDYWRFTPQGLAVLLEDYPHKILGWHGYRQRPAAVWALALREAWGGGGPVAPEQFEQYRRLLHKYAREPLPWRRRLSYQIGRMLFGSALFAPYLDREHWETECLTPSLP
jgi:SAM-dependent methyltransferase